MLFSRILTALILLPLAISAILLLPNDIFALVFALVMLIGAYEWCNFIQLQSVVQKLVFLAINLFVYASLWLTVTHIPELLFELLIMLFWSMALLLVLNFPASAKIWQDKANLTAILGISLLTLTWYAVVSLHAYNRINIGDISLTGPMLVLMFMILVWIADTGAYFSGRKWGKNKLAPQVSPGKSIEGVVGGLVLAIVVAWFFCWWVGAEFQTVFIVTVITVVTVLFSVIGDLMESMFKRQSGIKDSGNILPGHGGVLDRIDSLTAAGPVFLVSLNYMGAYL